MGKRGTRVKECCVSTNTIADRECTLIGQNLLSVHTTLAHPHSQ